MTVFLNVKIAAPVDDWGSVSIIGLEVWSGFWKVKLKKLLQTECFRCGATWQSIVLPPLHLNQNWSDLLLHTFITVIYHITCPLHLPCCQSVPQVRDSSISGQSDLVPLLFPVNSSFPPFAFFLPISNIIIKELLFLLHGGFGVLPHNFSGFVKCTRDWSLSTAMKALGWGILGAGGLTVMAVVVAVDGWGRGSLAMRQPGEPKREQLLWWK